MKGSTGLKWVNKMETNDLNHDMAWYGMVATIWVYYGHYTATVFFSFWSLKNTFRKKMDIRNITSMEVWRNNYKKKEKNMKKIYSQKGELMFYKSL